MKRIITLALIFVLSLLTVSCGKENESGEYKIYYVNTDKDGLSAVNYDYEATDTNGQINEALEKLASDPGEVDYIATIPSGVDMERWELDDSSLTLYITGAYEELDVFTEILVRAAMVETLTQLDGVDSVSLFVNGFPYTDSNGENVGSMTADTFIDDFGQETDSLLTTDLTLYFSSADGVSLVPETRTVYYSRNVSIEKVVVEQLIKGTNVTDLLSTLPSGTKINSISVSENGVCIVNFDGTLETAVTGVTENVTLYSIVDSLTELDSIKQVQILVNGETPHLSNLDVDLSSPISRNEDIINVNADDSEDDGEEYIDETFEDDTVYLEFEEEQTE